MFVWSMEAAIDNMFRPLLMSNKNRKPKVISANPDAFATFSSEI